jgi:hypothetical protein
MSDSEAPSGTATQHANSRMCPNMWISGRKIP